MGVTRKQNLKNFRHFLIPCVSGDEKCSLFGIFGVLCFLVTPVLRFALLPYCQRLVPVQISPKKSVFVQLNSFNRDLGLVVTTPVFTFSIPISYLEDVDRVMININSQLAEGS